jgi:pimeloyl-ACP methyl ester carboxylesterase
LVQALRLERFHLVGAKYGGSVAIEYAARYPEHVTTLTVIGGPVHVAGQHSKVDVDSMPASIAAGGMLEWADRSMDSRLGSKVSADQRRWWVEMMAASDARATSRGIQQVARLDLRESLKKVAAPVLFITTRGNKLVPVQSFEQWTALARDAKVLALDGDAYHPAALHPRECIAALEHHIAGARASVLSRGTPAPRAT